MIDGLVEDVSRSGVFLRVPRAVLRPRELAEIDLDLPGEEPLHLAAEIVRVEDEPRAGVALRFVGDVERSRRPLANFIMRQHARR